MFDRLWLLNAWADLLQTKSTLLAYMFSITCISFQLKIMCFMHTFKVYTVEKFNGKLRNFFVFVVKVFKII